MPGGRHPAAGRRAGARGEAHRQPQGGAGAAAGAAAAGRHDRRDGRVNDPAGRCVACAAVAGGAAVAEGGAAALLRRQLRRLRGRLRADDMSAA